jgi:glutaredoxin
MKRLLVIIFMTCLISSLVLASKTTLYFFHTATCSHCIAENSFLDKIEPKYPDLEIKRLDVNEQENAELWKGMAEGYGTSTGPVPLTFIGDKYILGYGSDETTGKEIEEAIINCIENGCIDPIEKVTETPNNETIPFYLIVVAVVVILVIGFIVIKATGLV